jgi:hypothetical protein
VFEVDTGDPSALGNQIAKLNGTPVPGGSRPQHQERKQTASSCFAMIDTTTFPDLVNKFWTRVHCDVEKTPMSSFAAHILVSTSRSRLLAGGVVAGFLAVTLVPFFSVAGPVEDTIPQLGSRDFGWNANFWDFQLDPPQGSAHGPIKTDPKYPYNSQIQNGRLFTGGELRPPIVNTKDPILKPWAAEQMQATNEEVLSGNMAIPFTSQSRCWPGGVPGQLLFLQPMYFVQTANQIWMIWERDHFVRRIYLTDKHSKNVKPSWFGESIGHYEGGDTLVVDTIGLAAGKYHYIDSFRTPHTEKLHVVERFTISQDGRALTAIVTVEDPDTFNGPLTLKQTWRKNEVAMAEMVCAEDAGEDHFNQNLHPLPQADKPDF